MTKSPVIAIPKDIPICESSITGNSIILSFGTLPKVVLIGFPGYKVCCPIKTVSDCLPKNVIEFVSASLYLVSCVILNYYKNHNLFYLLLNLQLFEHSYQNDFYFL